MNRAVQQAAWSARLATGYEAYKRASGRRRYNAKRHEERLLRWGAIVVVCPDVLTKPPPRGFQSSLAAELGLSVSTICRDVAAIRRNPLRALLAADCVLGMLEDENET